MEQTSHPRIQWIDTAKLFGIYLVILGHISLTNQFVTDLIYSFYMPLFFFLSGLTVRKEKIINALKKM